MILFYPYFSNSVELKLKNKNIKDFDQILELRDIEESANI